MDKKVRKISSKAKKPRTIRVKDAIALHEAISPMSHTEQVRLGPDSTFAIVHRCIQLGKIDFIEHSVLVYLLLWFMHGWKPVSTPVEYPDSIPLGLRTTAETIYGLYQEGTYNLLDAKIYPKDVSGFLR